MKKDIYKDLPLYTFSNTLVKTHGDNQNCLIFGNFGALNYGDEALLAGQLEELRKIKKSNIKVISRFPDIVKRVHKVESIALTNIPSLIGEIAKCDYLIFGGGGLFCKNTAGIRGILFQLYSLIFFLFLPLILGKKIYALGIGFYNNTDPIVTFVASNLLRFATKITVRDKHSADFLQSKGLPAEFCKDNSFLMSLDPVKKVQEYNFIKENYNSKVKNIGIALKKPSAKHNTKLKEAIKDIIKQHTKGTEFWFYSLDTHPYYPSDQTINEEIINELKQEGLEFTYHFLPKEVGPKELFSTFQLMDFVIAMRLHSMIFSYRLGIPFVGINYDEKCTSFMETIGGSSVDLSKVTSNFLSRTYKLNK